MSDLISRQATIDAHCELCEDKGFCGDICPDVEVFRLIPSAQPEITDEQAIEHLQSTGWMQNHDREMYESGLREQLADDSGSYDSLVSCEDAISRQAAIDFIDVGHLVSPTELRWSDKDVVDFLKSRPSAQPETKQGEWIPHSEMCTFPGSELTSSGGVMCSSCGFKTHNRMHKLIGCPYNYCPICGTAMRKKNKNG